MPGPMAPRQAEKFSETARLVLSPNNFAHVDQWRSAVNASVQELVGADMAGFLLSAPGAVRLFSDQYDTRTAEKYPRLEPRVGRQTIWERQLHFRVWTRKMVYGKYLPEYYRTEYYNEYVVPAKAYHSAGISIPMGLGRGSDAVAGLLLHRDRKGGPGFADEETRVLSLLLPAFEAGVRAYDLSRQGYEAIYATLDVTGIAALLSDGTGRHVHHTPALEALLATAPDRQEINIAMDVVVQAMAPLGRGGASAVSAPQLASVCREIRSGRRRFRVTGSYIAAPSLSGSGDTLLLVLLECLTPPSPSPDSLRDRFGLTSQEARVAVCIADGMSNQRVAQTLHISPHTARRHTEHVFQKIGITSRAAVAAAIR